MDLSSLPRALGLARPAAGIALAAAMGNPVAPPTPQSPASADVTELAAAPARSTATWQLAPPDGLGPVHTRTLRDPALTVVARRLVSSAENSSLDWEAQYRYIEYGVEHDPAENRGYTAGLVGFTSKTHDLLDVVRRYCVTAPDSALASYLPALVAVDGTSSAAGLGPGFEAAWRQAADDERFRAVQRALVDEMYLEPAVDQALADGLGPLGQFAYFDALVMHGPGTRPLDFGGIRQAALRQASPPSAGGDQTRYLDTFLDARVWAMRQERAHHDVSRVEEAQRRFLREGNLDLTLPLSWSVYGDNYHLS